MNTAIPTLHQELLDNENQVPGVDIELAGKTPILENTTDKLLSRRSFLLGSTATAVGMTIATIAPAKAATEVKPYESNQYSLETENIIVEGQFTPYHVDTMQMNFGNRTGTAKLNTRYESQDYINYALAELRNITNDEDLLKIQEFIRNETAFYSSLEKIRAADVNSIYGGKVNIASILKQLYTLPADGGRDIFAAPEVLRFGIPNRVDGIFRKIIVEQREIYKNGKKIELQPGERVFEGITLDCLGGGYDSKFFSDLVRGSEKNFGYTWNPKKGYFEYDEKGQVGKPIAYPPRMNMQII